MDRIRQHYNRRNPHFAYICGGLRRIAVDGEDKRARVRLLAKGIRYYSQMQGMVFASHLLMKPTLFIDAGVNYGECLFAKPLFDTTPSFGFEANPALIHYIEKSRVYNDDVDVTVIAKAVSDSGDSNLTFYVNERYSGKSSVTRPDSLDGIREVIVPATTLDAEFRQRGCDLSRLLMKIDVEGYEPMVLRGATELLHAATDALVLLEFDSVFIHAAGIDPETFFTELSAMFEIFLIDKTRAVKVADYAGLPRMTEGEDRIHADLALTKFASETMRARFNKAFCHGSIMGYCLKVWGPLMLPA